jgi:CRP/FNR family transcriptional regulator, cyclic AMP receptor protein
MSGRDIPGLPRFRPEDLKSLAAEGIVRSYRSRTVLVSEGDESDSFYIILSGRVKVFVSDAHGKEIVLATEGPGDYFGEMALDDRPRSASVITLEPSRISVISRAKLLEFIATQPGFALDLVHKLIRRIRILTDSVKSLALMDVHSRVARLLAELAETNGDGQVVERMTQQEIASRVGASREMISRVMKDLSANGYIAVDKRQITILKPHPREH